MIAARLGLLDRKHELERDLFIRKLESNKKEEEKINDKWKELEKQGEALLNMLGRKRD